MILLNHPPSSIFCKLLGLITFECLWRSWNSAASDNCLWQLQYAICFGNSEDISKMKGRRDGELVEDKEETKLKEDIATRTGVDWRDAFKRKYKGMLLYCLSRSLVQLDLLWNTCCKNESMQLGKLTVGLPFGLFTLGSALLKCSFCTSALLSMKHTRFQ